MRRASRVLRRGSTPRPASRKDSSPTSRPTRSTPCSRRPPQSSVEIVSRISRTNVETVVEGRILADWIAERDVSWRRLRVLQSALRAAAPSYDRHGGPGSVRSVTTFSTARRHAELDALALRINAIDARIQQANWETELL